MCCGWCAVAPAIDKPQTDASCHFSKPLLPFHNRRYRSGNASMVKHVRSSQLRRLTAASLATSRAQTRVDARPFSVLNRPAPSYEGHVPLTPTERLGLALGSGLGSFLNPRRGGIFATPYVRCVWYADTARSHRIFRRSNRATLFHR
jgi:hypothetical protein